MKKTILIMILLASIAAVNGQNYSKSTTILRKQNFSLSAFIDSGDTTVSLLARNAKYKQLIDYFEVFFGSPTEMQGFLSEAMKFYDNADKESIFMLGDVYLSMTSTTSGKAVGMRVNGGKTAITKKNLLKLSQALDKWDEGR